MFAGGKKIWVTRGRYVPHILPSQAGMFLSLSSRFCLILEFDISHGMPKHGIN